MYTAILFAVDTDTGSTLSFSREVDTDDKETIYNYMKQEGKLVDDAIDSILLVRNGDSGSRHVQAAPDVFRHWTAENGDFENDEEKDK